MSILTIILIIAAAAVLLYLINRYIPMDAKIKMILNWVVVIVVVVWLLKVLGVWANVKGASI